MSADVFDERRRVWIAAHAGIFLCQKRRAELLGKRMRARSRSRIGVRPDPHEDQVTAPFAFRTAATSSGALESALVGLMALTVPLGWPLGRLLYGGITALIPERLRAYPIPALVWIAVLCGLPLPVLFEPRPTLWSALAVPWLLAQIPAVFVVAGGYGVLEGWLAVDGSTDWWPMTPSAPDVDDDRILGSGEVAMATVLDLAAQPAKQPSGVAERRAAGKKQWLPLVSGAVVAAIGILWYFFTVVSGVASAPVKATDGTIQAAGAADRPSAATALEGTSPI